MIFKRRDKPTIPDRMREMVSPRKGFWRGLDYIGKRMRRLPDSPHRVALGFACGAFASFTPFFGLHFFVAAGLALLLRGNVIAGLFGTIVGNPLSFPFISASALWLGRWMLGQRGNGSDFEAVMGAFGNAFNSIWATMKSWFGYEPTVMDGLAGFFWHVFLPYLIGGILPGLLAGAIAYWVLGPIVATYQDRRRRKIQDIQARQQRNMERKIASYVITEPGE